MKRLLTIMILVMAGCTTTISGNLKDHAGQPIFSPDARVNISSLKGAELQEAQVVRVERDGSFLSQDLKPGQYLVEALVPGFLPESKSVTVDSDQSVVLELKEIETAKAGTIGTGHHVEFSRGSGGADLMPPNL